MALVGINHVAVEVGSLDAAIAFLSRVGGEVDLRGRSGRMAFVDLGDQFIALEQVTRPVAAGHIGLVVDDQRAAVARARDAGFRIVGSHDVVDPWGNTWQVVDYRDVQFTKAAPVLGGMGLGRLEKSERALVELRSKGLAD